MFGKSFAVAAACLGSLGLAASSSNLGQVVNLNDISYYVGGSKVGTLSGYKACDAEKIVLPDTDLFPLTVIHAAGANFTGDYLSSLVSAWLEEDDVFQTGFLNSIYVDEWESLDRQSLANYNDNLLLYPTIGSTISSLLPNGPYFVSLTSGAIFQAFRLYKDSYLAFTQGTVPSDGDSFIPLPGLTEDIMAKSIAVPSRLYSTISPDKPLAGLRFAVKDIFHVKGLRTSAGSRSYYYMYGTQNVTAPSIQKLIDLGAVLVGKLGLVQFANAGSPTADWVDLHAPFNPRGDGYQDPSGSSAGSGAAIAAYDWLDFTIGSDTGGSMRGPAGNQGVWGNRPSTGAVSMDHVVPLSSLLDTAGVMTRNASLWATIAKEWYSELPTNFTSLPRNLYYSASASGYGPGDGVSDVAYELIESFMTRLEGFLGVNRTLANVTELWTQTRHQSAPTDLSVMLNTSYAFLTAVYQWNNVGKKLFTDWAAVNEGREPFINPNPLARWNWGQENDGEAQYPIAERNMTIFRDWWSTHGYGRHDPNSCSEGFYVYPWSLGTTSYRNTFGPGSLSPPLGFSDWAIAGYAGAGEIIVPIGEAPYNSTISGKTEYLPVTMAVQVARECDFVLGSLVQALEEANITKPVSTGSRMYK